MEDMRSKSFSTVIQSYEDDGRMMMIGCVQWNPVSRGARTRDRKISRPAHNLLSYRGSLSCLFAFAILSQTNLSGSFTIIVQVLAVYLTSLSA